MKRRDYMKKLKHVMAGIAFTFTVGLMLSCQVKAETTIDLNGNKVEVSVWTKQTSMKDGSYQDHIIRSRNNCLLWIRMEIC